VLCVMFWVAEVGGTAVTLWTTLCEETTVALDAASVLDDTTLVDGMMLVDAMVVGGATILEAPVDPLKVMADGYVN